jgi:hypothetical protein
VTDPVGVPVPDDFLTVAVSVTEAGGVTEVGFAASVVVVAAPLVRTTFTFGELSAL